MELCEEITYSLMFGHFLIDEREGSWTLPNYMSLDGYDLFELYARNLGTSYLDTFIDIDDYITGNLRTLPRNNPHQCSLDYFMHRLALNNLYDYPILLYRVTIDLNHALFFCECLVPAPFLPAPGLRGVNDNNFPIYMDYHMPPFDYFEDCLTRLEFLVNLLLLIETHVQFPRTNVRYRRLAFAMGTHTRLGRGTLVSRLDNSLVRLASSHV